MKKITTIIAILCICSSFIFSNHHYKEGKGKGKKRMQLVHHINFLEDKLSLSSNQFERLESLKLQDSNAVFSLFPPLKFAPAKFLRFSTG